jgi:hypothetical protein
MYKARAAIAVWPDRHDFHAQTGIEGAGVVEIRGAVSDAVANGEWPSGTLVFRLPRRMGFVSPVPGGRQTLARECPECGVSEVFHRGPHGGPCCGSTCHH